MKILIACEESQSVTLEFRKLGFEAYSCDIIDESGGYPEWHIKDDVQKVINGYIKVINAHDCIFEDWDEDFEMPICPECFKEYGECYHPGPTMDYQYEEFDGELYAKVFEWDAVIAFPPCTDLAMSGAKHFEQKRKDGRQQKSIEFFLALANAPIKHIAIENPIGVMSTYYRKPDQIVNPFDFGDPARKPTCLWLKNLPKLKSTNLGDAPLFGSSLDMGEFHTTKSGKVLPKWYNLPPSENRAKIRSKTFPGIAEAMAKQWGQYLKESQKINQNNEKDY